MVLKNAVPKQSAFYISTNKAFASMEYPPGIALVNFMHYNHITSSSTTCCTQSRPQIDIFMANRNQSLQAGVPIIHSRQVCTNTVYTHAHSYLHELYTCHSDEKFVAASKQKSTIWRKHIVYDLWRWPSWRRSMRLWMRRMAFETL